MKRFCHKALPISLLLAFSLSACSKHVSRRSGEGGAADVEEDPEQPKKSVPSKAISETEVVNYQAEDGIKSGTQIYNTMLAVTGVQGSAVVPNGKVNEPIETVFRRDLLSAMPLENRIQAFGAGHQSAIVKLAVMVCHSMVEDPALAEKFFGGSVDLTQAPSAFSGKDAVASALIKHFWGSIDVKVDKKKIAADLVALQTNLIGGLTGPMATSAQGTKNVVKGACTAVASSLPGILL
jgi:hypothetical protein